MSVEATPLMTETVCDGNGGGPGDFILGGEASAIFTAGLAARLAVEGATEVAFFAGEDAGAGLPISWLVLTPGVEIRAVSWMFRRARVTLP